MPDAPSRSPVRPELGPTLPQLLHARFGIAPRTVAVAAVALAVLLAAAILIVARLTADEQLVHQGPPVFNMVYDPDAVSEVEPRGDELVRLALERPNVRVAVTVRRLEVPAYAGDTARGLLPTLAERRLDALRGAHPGFRFRDEGRSSVNRSPGYQLAYRTGPPGRRTYWREVYVVPDEPSPRLGVVLTFEDERRGRVSDEERMLVHAARSAMRSFAFGTERPP